MTAMKGPRTADSADRSRGPSSILRLPEKARGQLSFQTWPFLLAQLFLVDKLFGGLIQPAAATGVEEATKATSEPEHGTDDVAWTAPSVGDTVEPAGSSVEPLVAGPQPEAPLPTEPLAIDRAFAELPSADQAEPAAFIGGAGGGGSVANLAASDAGGHVGVDLIDNVLSTVDPVTAAVAPVLETVTDTVTGIVDSALNVVEPLTSAVAPVLETVTDTVTGIVDSALSAVEPVTSALAPVLETVTDTATGIVDSALSVVEPVTSAVAPVLETVTDTATGIVDSALSTVEPVTAAVAPVLETVTGTVDSALSTVEPVAAAVAPVLETVTDTATGIVDSALSTAEPVTSAMAPVLETLTDTATGTVDSILGAAQRSVEATKIASDVVPGETDATTDAVTAGVKSGLTAVTGGASDLPATVTAMADEVGDGVGHIGGSFLGSSGTLEFNEPPSSHQDNSLFADGRYTDLGIAMNNGSVGDHAADYPAPDSTAPESLASGPAVDSDGTHHDEQVLPPVQEITNPVLASATGLVDELGLRHGDGLL